MSSILEPSARPARSWSRLLVRGLLILLVAVEAVYVVGGYALVRSGQVERWINTEPDKLRITFESVWPIVPGVVRVTGFRIVNLGRPDQLEGTVDRVWGAINPLELPAGRLHIVWLRATGVTFRHRARPESAAEAEKGLAAGLPPIEGVAWAPYTGPPRGPKTNEKRLALVFTRAHLDDVRDVWIGERRLRGEGTVVASVTVESDGKVAIPLADVRFDRAKVENGTEVTYSGIKLRVKGELRAFDPDDADAIPGLLKVRLDADARMPSGAAFLNVYFRSAPWIRFSGGEAALAVHASLDGGRLVPGDFVELAADDLRADFAGFTARGKARTRLDVAGGPSAPEAKVSVEFERYGLRREKGKPEPFLVGKGLRVAAVTPASITAIPPSEFSGRLELGRAELPRLDVLHDLLPLGGDFRIRGGAARVEGAFDVTESGAACKGAVSLKAEQLSLETGGVAMKGTVSVSVRVPRGNLLKRKLEADGTLLSLDRFSFSSAHEKASGPDWNARFSFPRARLDLGDAFGANGGLDLQASDSRPVVVFLSADQPMSGWKKKLLTVGEIKGTGRFALGGETLKVDDCRVGWSNVEVRARFRMTPKGTYGKAVMKAGILKAGIGLEGEKRKLKVLGTESWFAEP